MKKIGIIKVILYSKLILLVPNILLSDIIAYECVIIISILGMSYQGCLDTADPWSMSNA